MKKKIGIIVATLSLFLLTACSTSDMADQSAETNTTTTSETVQEELTLEHPLGTTTLQTNPQKVVVLDYGILDALDDAGLSDVIVATPQSSHMPDFLSEYSSSDYANAGSIKQADFETISDLQPDLILITSRLTESYEELSKIAPTVFLTMPGAEYMDTFYENIDVLKTIFTAKEDVFSTEVANIKERANTIAEAATGKTGLLIQANDNQFNVFGLGSRYGVVFTDFGFTLTDETIAPSIHGQSSSFEYIVSQDPDYLFVIDRSAAIGANSEGAKQLLENDLTANMKAFKEDHVVYLNSTNWYTVAGGIQSTKAMLTEMETALDIKEAE